MRTVSKGAECNVLRAWKRSNRTSPQNIHYDYLDGVTREAVLSQLVKEQAGLCAYTMKQIIHRDGKWQAHIEHIRPRSQHDADSSVSWTNLLACVPQPGGACEYGAVRKSAYDPAKNPFVSPTMRGLAVHFRFRENGEIEGLTPEAVDTSASGVLNLNHIALVNDRGAKILGALGRRPSAAAARRRAEELRKPDRSGNMEPYCEAVAQVLEVYAIRLERKAARIGGVKRR